MRRIQRTEVTVETDEITTIRSSQGIVASPCPHCGKAVAMMTPEQAAIVSGATIRAIYRWLEAGWIHYAETPGGSLLVCPDSILKLAVKPHRAD